MNAVQQIQHLCKTYTSLSDEDVDLIIEKSKTIQAIADIAQANIFIDCPVKGDRNVLVVAEAIPTTSHSLYKGSVVGKIIYERYEPAVFRVYRTGKPALINRAITHEGVHVNQNVMPIKNDSNKTIGMLILEKDITAQVRHENELAILSETTEEFSRTFFDLITKNRIIPDLIEEALVLLRADGKIMYANNFAIGLMEIHCDNSLTNGDYINSPICEMLPFIQENDYLNNGVIQREAIHKDKVYILRGIDLQNKDEVMRILILRDITDLRDKERQLMVKSAVIKEIHHRVKNNLQTVASLLRLQLRRGVPDEAKILFQESLNRIMGIATVHEVLSYSGIETVRMNQVIEKISKILVNNIQNDPCKVSIQLDIEDIELSSNQAVSLALILTELVQNSVKHGFVGFVEGMITIQLLVDNGQVQLIIQDDGVGFEHQTDTEHLGLEIVRNLTNYDLNGEFEIERLSEKGTRAKVVFPIE
ncbi:sensor histidine kinase [Paenibacillus sp. GCM10027628]|uniref:sensor histidine kinase n=1 Tax=Paenibacillus sp. GCM10027628 TaxID=3273413 RepID=UPI0036290040